MTILKSFVSAFRQRPYRNIFVTLMVVIFVDAALPNAFARGRFADLMLTAILLAALVETVRSRRNAIWALALGLPAIAARLLAAFREDTPAQNTTVLFFTAVFFGFLIWNLLHDLNRGDRLTSERIFGALCAYIFIGILFALAYAHMEYRQPGTFATSQDAILEQTTAESNLMPIFIYYSFVTLTTLGYGDITPVAEQAQTLAWFEALVGQLYLAVMVAGFVAVHISESMAKKQGDPPPDDPGGAS
jgi:voltage-gated potassium channel